MPLLDRFDIFKIGFIDHWFPSTVASTFAPIVRATISDFPVDIFKD